MVDLPTETLAASHQLVAKSRGNMTEQEFEKEVLAVLPNAVFAHDELMGTFFAITKENTTCIHYDTIYELWFVGNNYHFPHPPESTLEKALSQS